MQAIGSSRVHVAGAPRVAAGAPRLSSAPSVAPVARRTRVAVRAEGEAAPVGTGVEKQGPNFTALKASDGPGWRGRVPACDGVGGARPSTTRPPPPPPARRRRAPEF